ncbi:hypothetical protein, partial [Aquisphaera insulae]|uniref:hypothetical protein n=1 Tax=Aquisphaera insulae TaxID=2712864 RepID=UPI00196AA299
LEITMAPLLGKPCEHGLARSYPMNRRSGASALRLTHPTKDAHVHARGWRISEPGARFGRMSLFFAIPADPAA